LAAEARRLQKRCKLYFRVYCEAREDYKAKRVGGLPARGRQQSNFPEKTGAAGKGRVFHVSMQVSCFFPALLLDCRVFYFLFAPSG